MRRILLLLAVVALMAVMMVSAGPASASTNLASAEDGTFLDSDSDGDFDIAVLHGIHNKLVIGLPIEDPESCPMWC